MKVRKFIGIILFVVIALIGCSIKPHNCTEFILWDEAIAIDADGTSHSSGFCTICGRHISFVDGKPVE